jgi:hypothetical protein
MRALQITFFSLLCALSMIWALLALSAQLVHLEHRQLITAIQNNTMPAPKKQELDRAIASYEWIMHFVSCNAQLHNDLALLLTKNADLAVIASDAATEDKSLAKTLATLTSLLSCTPMNGKAWLDYAMLNTYLEGFNKRSLNAYKMSQQVSPGESWLAEKRLLFAVKFRLLFDAAALEAANKDIATLERAALFRLKNVFKAANINSVQDLYALFKKTNGNSAPL